MPWNNLFLIPLVIVGGFIAFFFGRTIVGGMIRAFGRATAHKPVQAPLQSMEPRVSSGTIEQMDYEQPRPRRTMELPPRQPTLAERLESWSTQAMSLEDAQEQAFMNLVQLDKEQERRERLLSAARKQAKDHALRGSYIDKRNGDASPNV